MVKTEALSASLEDYLEAIFHIESEKQAARAKDIAKRLSVNNSSVTGALRSLSEKGLVNYAPYDLITLTPSGKVHAREIVRRHEALMDFFIKVLGVAEEEAEETACKMEHTVSRTIIDKLIRFVEFVELCPRGGDGWIREFTEVCREGRPFGHCESCITQCLSDYREKSEKLGEASDRELCLRELKPGQRGKILKIKGRGGVKKQMADLGIEPGNVISLEGISEEDESMTAKVKGYHFTLSGEEASRILLELL